MRNAALLVLALVWLLAPTVVAAEMTAEKLFEASSPAVARVVVSDFTRKDVKFGSGFFVSAEGKLVTNAHVIAGGAFIRVVLPNNKSFPVTGSLGIDEAADLAVLKVRTSDMKFLRLAGAPPKIGSRAYAIGNPEGLTNTISEGIVSGVRKKGSGGVLLQTTAAISSGSSGGPLLDADGRVIGVTTASLADGQNLNFAVPIDRVSTLLNRQTPLTAISSVLYDAIKIRDVKAINALLDQGADPNARYGSTSTWNPTDVFAPHHTGSALVSSRLYAGSPEAIAELLVERGANACERDERGFTPLHHFFAYETVLAALLKHGADVNARTNDGDTALHWAARNPDIPSMRVLLEQKADPHARNLKGETPLYIAEGDAEADALLRRYGAMDVGKVPANLHTKDQLQRARHRLRVWTARGDPARVQAAIDQGASVIAATTEQGPLIQWAEHPKVIHLLVKNGANLREIYAGGDTLLHLAAKQGNRPLIEFLIANGLDVNQSNTHRETPLVLCISPFGGNFLGKDGESDEQVRSAAVQALIRAGADVNVRDARGRTPLGWAEEFDRQCATMLRKAGAKK